jgi:hypothetical protein
MMASDGNKLIGEVPKQSMVQCSRWSELVTSLSFHAELAEVAEAKTEFRLLNVNQPITLGLGPENDGTNHALLQQKFDKGPGGGTPLCHHIRQIIEEIKPMERQLREMGQKAVIVLATDGQASDGDVLSAMKPLERLPVWLVIRLCTDESSVVNYWSDIDRQLEVDVDVLDDLVSEAEEVKSVNRWLRYGVPLQRLREFGISTKEFDMLDEKTLTSEQMRVCVAAILGGKPDDYPHPEVDWRGFKSKVTERLDAVDLTWSPLKKSMQPWLNVKRIGETYGGQSKCSIM